MGPTQDAEGFSPSEYVNLLAGSFTKGDEFSTGNTLPLIGRPWGFNHWSIQTNHGESAWWFSGNDHEFRWLRCTHQPSPWIGDYGYFLFGPQMGPFASTPVGFFEPRAAKLRPYGASFRTAPDGMRIALAPSMRGAVLHVGFPAHSKIEKRICFAQVDEVSETSRSSFRAVARKNSGGVGGRDFALFLTAIADEGAKVQHYSGATRVCFEYNTDTADVYVRLATSFISFDQADFNLKTELDDVALDEGFIRRTSTTPSKSVFDRTWRDARAEWDALLGRAHINVPTTHGVDGAMARSLTTFYTGLYRALTFPRRLDEPSPQSKGSTHHWSPYYASMRRERKLFPGVLVTDNGFWDTFRTVYPLLSLLYPDHLSWIAEGWVNAAEEGGWLPKWASPGYRNSMVGTYGDVVVADALVSGILPKAKRQAAWDALRRDAFDEQPPSGGAVGRVGLDHYDRNGFIPYDVGVSDCVSRTLDFAYADWAIARAADSMEDAKIADKLRDRARRALKLSFDPTTGLMRPKSRMGSFKRDFSPIRWGDGYTEGSAWHHSFPAFDVTTLSELHGSKENLRRKLDDMLKENAVFEPGGYKRTIHEMREFRALAMGQYGHNNQPSHHALYVYALAGDSNTTNKRVRHVLETAYGTDFYAGDEDNGEMGAWYVLAASGLFPIPGTDSVVMTAPLFDQLTLHIGGEKKTILRIFAHRGIEDPSATDVSEIYFNGTRLGPGTAALRYAAVRDGGDLHFYFAGGPTRLESSMAALSSESSLAVEEDALKGKSKSPTAFATRPPPGTEKTLLRHQGTMPHAPGGGQTPPDDPLLVQRHTPPVLASVGDLPDAALGVVGAAALLVGLLLGRLTAGSSRRGSTASASKKRAIWKKPNSHVV